MNTFADNDDERESMIDEDETKSVRSKKSNSVYSGVAKSFRNKIQK